MSDYQRISRAINFINHHVQQQPTLDDMAAHLHLSPYHFQRLFSRWAGVTPKKFLQLLTLENAKQLLAQDHSILQTASQLGLSSGSRLYDHFVQLEAITPGEFKSGGKDISISYGLHDSPFGLLFIAITARGIIKLAFLETTDISHELRALKHNWPQAQVNENRQYTAGIVSNLFHLNKPADRPLSLLVSGTNFQINVWKALLQIPAGNIATYSQIAHSIGHSNAARAVGTAIAANPIAMLIPCHRVIRRSGHISGFRWGETRKQAMLAWEIAKYHNR